MNCIKDKATLLTFHKIKGKFKVVHALAKQRDMVSLCLMFTIQIIDIKSGKNNERNRAIG